MDAAKVFDHGQDVVKIGLSIALLAATGSAASFLSLAPIAVNSINRACIMLGILKKFDNCDKNIQREQKKALSKAWESVIKRMDTDTIKKICEQMEGYIDYELKQIPGYNDVDVAKVFERIINDKNKF
ncbi:MAG: hypothetical protein FWE80_06095, partial [Oscillospiraceae bacterium]|nr:hypothetical protein [Oscillospiraceae bacterium]